LIYLSKNDDDVYPLHMAASEGQIDCLKILLDLRADITVTDKRGQTPLDLARVWGHRKCAK
jgi:ankyrin repeat protein